MDSPLFETIKAFLMGALALAIIIFGGAAIYFVIHGALQVLQIIK